MKIIPDIPYLLKDGHGCIKYCYLKNILHKNYSLKFPFCFATLGSGERLIVARVLLSLVVSS